jgi:hypothetical protein
LQLSTRPPSAAPGSRQDSSKSSAFVAAGQRVQPLHAALTCRPASAAATADARPQTASAAGGAARFGGKSSSSRAPSRQHHQPPWVVTGAAALIHQHYKHDMILAGALLDSNVNKDISSAIGSSSSSSSKGRR